MRYDEAETYVARVAELMQERSRLVLCIDDLSHQKGVTNKKQALKQRLKTVERRLERTTDLSGFTWPDLFRLWSETFGWVWTPEQVELNEQNTEAYEGKGEKALRHRLGLPMVATLGSCDLPTGEIKYVGQSPETFRVGKMGKRMYVRTLRELSDDAVTDSMLDGEVSAGKLYNTLPENVRTKLQTNLSPVTVLSEYPAMYLTTDHGYGFVPREHYAHAFSLSAVTQMSPKFRLKREYVEMRLRQTIDVSR